MNQRPKISVYIASSLDGYIARKDGDLSWLDCVHSSDEDYGFKDFFSTVDSLVLGRHTYEAVFEFDEWPYQGKRVIVLSTTLDSVSDEAELFKGEIGDLVQKLSGEGVNHIYVDGGLTISRFLEAGMVDELILSTIPVFLGEGIPLFSPMDREHKCRLISSKSYSSGLVQQHYEMVT